MKNLTFRKLIYKVVTGFILLLFSHPGATAQQLDVAYVPTPDFVVEWMLDMADVGPGDYVIDLGCGDGRINIAAAKRGALGHGVDLDPDRINEARENAEKEGVSDKLVFIEENIYNTDFSRATVVAMYLFPDINIELRPKLLEKLEPGTRIVSHDFGMGEWKADKQQGRMDTHAVYLWIVPARVEGTWNWQTAGSNFKMTVNQNYQEIDAGILCDGISLNVKNSLLSGKRISFSVADDSSQKEFVFSGQAEGQKIEGIVQVHDGNNKTVENWSAVME